MSNQFVDSQQVSEQNFMQACKGQYRLVRLIGRGSYGSVFEAVALEGNCLNIQPGTQVAIKLVRGVLGGSAIVALRLLREIAILRNLKHTNIMKFFGLLPPVNINDLKDIYIVCEFVITDLHKILHSSQALTPKHVQYIMYQMLMGIKSMHDQDIIHRDLKPANILIDGKVNVSICDFGLSRSTSILPRLTKLIARAIGPKLEDPRNPVITKLDDQQAVELMETDTASMTSTQRYTAYNHPGAGLMSTYNRQVGGDNITNIPTNDTTSTMSRKSTVMRSYSAYKQGQTETASISGASVHNNPPQATKIQPIDTTNTLKQKPIKEKKKEQDNTPALERTFTLHVATRWYRSPELILLANFKNELAHTNYDDRVDIWSIGCIFAELLQMQLQPDPTHRRALFPGDFCYPFSPQANNNRSVSSTQTAQRISTDQLKTIFDTIGYPTYQSVKETYPEHHEQIMKYIHSLNPQYYNNPQLQYINQIPPFHHRFSNVSPEALDFLTKMLNFDHKKRPSAKECLLHPYLADILNELNTTNEIMFGHDNELPPYFDFEEDAVNVHTLRALLVEQVLIDHPSLCGQYIVTPAFQVAMENREAKLMTLLNDIHSSLGVDSVSSSTNVEPNVELVKSALTGKEVPYHQPKLQHVAGISDIEINNHIIYRSLKALKNASRLSFVFFPPHVFQRIQISQDKQDDEIQQITNNASVSKTQNNNHDDDDDDYGFDEYMCNCAPDICACGCDCPCHATETARIAKENKNKPKEDVYSRHFRDDDSVVLEKYEMKGGILVKPMTPKPQPLPDRVIAAADDSHHYDSIVANGGLAGAPADMGDDDDDDIDDFAHSSSGEAMHTATNNQSLLSPVSNAGSNTYWFDQQNSNINSKIVSQSSNNSSLNMTSTSPTSVTTPTPVVASAATGATGNHPNPHNNINISSTPPNTINNNSKCTSPNSGFPPMSITNSNSQGREGNSGVANSLLALRNKQVQESQHFLHQQKQQFQEYWRNHLPVGAKPTVVSMGDITPHLRNQNATSLEALNRGHRTTTNLTWSNLSSQKLSDIYDKIPHQPQQIAPATQPQATIIPEKLPFKLTEESRNYYDNDRYNLARRTDDEFEEMMQQQMLESAVTKTAHIPSYTLAQNGSNQRVMPRPAPVGFQAPPQQPVLGGVGLKGLRQQQVNNTLQPQLIQQQNQSFQQPQPNVQLTQPPPAQYSLSMLHHRTRQIPQNNPQPK